jgi:integrase
MTPLRYEDGGHIKEPKAAERDLREAYARFLLEKTEEVEVHTKTNLLDVCIAYLEYAKKNGAEKTHFDRADTLFDFCFGLPPEYRNKDGSGTKESTTDQKREMRKKRIHSGFGAKIATELTPLDIDKWIATHENWSGGQRTRIQAVKRALNYAVERQLIPHNPIRGYKVARPNSRVTYISPEQEEACYEYANPTLKTAIRVCIRTGARFGCEFAALTSNHVHDHGDRMEWVFKAGEIKNRRKRTIYITEPEIMEIVRKRIEAVPRGTPIFRNSTDTPWERRNLSARFRALKARLARNGVHLDEDACMYSCRHTYAKRTLQGYWSGKPINIETLAELMGNTVQVCREHYLQWSPLDKDRLWDAC